MENPLIIITANDKAIPAATEKNITRLKNLLSNANFENFLFAFLSIESCQLNGMALIKKAKFAAAIYRIASEFMGTRNSSTRGKIVNINHDAENIDAGEIAAFVNNFADLNITRIDKLKKIARNLSSISYIYNKLSFPQVISQNNKQPQLTKLFSITWK